MNIGIFDSGLGGLSILKELIKTLPEYNYVYLGDNARVPYGGRSPELVYEFTTHALKFLFAKNCQLIILACNTASATALRRIQHEFVPRLYHDRKVLGVIRPAIEVIEQAEIRRVGVIGTYATIRSGSFIKEIHKINPKIKVWQNPAPLLVPIIEENEIKWEGLNLILTKYLKPLLKHKIDGLILGCTHYGLIEKQVQQAVGKHIQIIYQGKVVAKKLKQYLNKHQEIDQKLGKQSRYQFYVTDLNPRYRQMAKIFFAKSISLQQIRLD